MTGKKPKYRPIVFRGKERMDYVIDDNGDIFSTKFGKFRRLAHSYRDGYPKVKFHFNGSKYTVDVHRVVAETFHPERPLPQELVGLNWDSFPKGARQKILDYLLHPDRFQVNHIDHNKMNYHPSNLEWVSVQENNQKYQDHRIRMAA